MKFFEKTQIEYINSIGCVGNKNKLNLILKMSSTSINMSLLVIGLQFMIVAFVAGQNELFSVSFCSLF